MVEEAYGVYDQACLDVMIHTGLVECLAGAPDRQKGLHVSEIQKALDIDSRKLTIILRYLSTGCWVRETDEGVFTLNRPSLELLQGTNGRRFLRYAPSYCRNSRYSVWTVAILTALGWLLRL